jgi:hypothetical protein
MRDRHQFAPSRTRQGIPWWARQDANLQPDRYERPALTIELQALADPLNEDAGSHWYGRCRLDAIEAARGNAMPARSQDPAEYSTLAERCAVAIADAHWFRNMATRALRDGKPKGRVRAASARTAARIILMRAKQDAALHRMIVDAAAAGRKVT